METIHSEYSKDNDFHYAKYIGILERLLIVPSLVLGIYEILFVVMGIKVFSDFKQEDSKMYDRNAFIIGNFLSLLMAAISVLYLYLAASSVLGDIF